MTRREFPNERGEDSVMSLAMPSEDKFPLAVAEIVACPKCKHGVMIEKNVVRGPFLSCSNFPGCKAAAGIANSGARHQISLEKTRP
jgi:ssDNA-binding Zn-finger/Zn-ribbon topoisomerase 1